MDCRVLLAQTNPALGNVSRNLADHVARIQAAIEERADLVLFPELSLSGYFLKDQTASVAIDLSSPALERLLELSKRITIGFGLVERSRDGRLYNAYAILEDGRVIAVHRKVHLVTYGMFEESRDFAPGERYEPVESRHGRFGVLLCEDLWHMGGLYLHFLASVDALIVPSASPARGVELPGADVADEDPLGLASVRSWRRVLAFASQFTQTWVLYVNRVGFEDGIGFSGHSSVWDPFGARRGELAHFEPGSLTERISSAALDRARAVTPLRRDEKPWILAQALARQQAMPMQTGQAGQVGPVGPIGKPAGRVQRP